MLINQQRTSARCRLGQIESNFSEMKKLLGEAKRLVETGELPRHRQGRIPERVAKSFRAGLGDKKAPQSGSQMMSFGVGAVIFLHQRDDVEGRAELSVLAGAGDLAQHGFIKIALGVAILHRQFVEVDHLHQQRRRGNGEAHVLHVRGVRRAVLRHDPC